MSTVATDDILARGYFPKELPPPFATAGLAAAHAKLGASKKADSLCLRLSYSKYASVRRTLAIPNPAHFVPLAYQIADNWNAIEARCSKSNFSRTVPTIDTDRAIRGNSSLDSMPAARAEIRTGSRYILKADVANFYGSIYTHAISWAFHTKETAKQNRRTKKLFGNLLDEASRNVQSGQTIGLPIGPDTSFAIAEAILSAVDEIVYEKLPNGVLGYRFVDDYEFACASLGEAEVVRTTLLDALAEYELRLNARKTTIVELPDLLDTTWAHEVSSFSLTGNDQHSLESQLLRYFSRAFELTRQHPGEPVLKYAVRRLSQADLSPAPVLAQRLLFQAATVDPGTLHTALHLTQKLGGAVDKQTVERALNAIVVQHAPLQHGGDVAWALWGALVFDVELNDRAVAALQGLTDPVAILVALHAEQEGKLHGQLDRTRWNALISPAELFDSRWLLVYESTGKGWLTSSTGDPATSDPFFESCRAEKVSFYDLGADRTIPASAFAAHYDV